jgi:uncharacterized repeat protein (TIGR01451 family)
MKKYLLVVLMVVMLLMSVSGHAVAGILYAAPSSGGLGDCTSWPDACTLQQAIANAVSGDEIWVLEGVHYPGTARTDTFTLKNGVAIYGGFAGTETARSGRDWQVNLTILSGDIDNNDTDIDGDGIIEPGDGDSLQGANSYHVVTGSFNDSTAVIDGFIITGGQADGTYPNNTGGGMYNNYSSPTITYVVLSGNTASQTGGGMGNIGSSPTLSNVSFSRNNADSFGGGMGNSYSSPILTNVTFNGNQATFGNGGGMWNYSYSNPTLTNVTFSGNYAYNIGGGMYNNYSSPTLTNVTFSGNTAFLSGGGGMWSRSGNPTLINVIIANSTGGDCDGPVNASSSYNLIKNSASACGLSHGVNGNIIGLDPVLGSLADNGGFTKTHALLSGSPAINAGTCTGAPNTDQRGVSRPKGADCDIGAYEFIENTDISVTKTDGVTTAVPGQSVTYTIVAANNGPSDDPSVSVTDNFPASLTCTYTSVASGGATGNTASGSGDISDTLNMPSGSSVTYTASCSIDPSATGTLSNTATATASVTDPTPGNNSATDSDTLTPEADISVTKTDGQSSIVAGDSLTYTISVGNAGPSDVSGVTVTDTFPAELNITGVSCLTTGGATCSASGTGNIADTVDMPAGSSITYMVNATLDPLASGTLSNTASVAVPGGVTDPDTGNNTSTDTDTVISGADLSVTKADSADPVQQNSGFSYTMTVTNNGPGSATGVTLTDPLPAGLGSPAATSTQGTCSITSGTLTCDIGSISSGASVTVTLNVTAPSAIGNIFNTATVGSTSTDPDSSNDSDTERTTIVSAAAMIALPRTGQTFMYTPGDDGDIQAGMKWPLTRFRDMGNGIMFDRLTGLGWLQDANCMASQYPAADTDGAAGDGKVTWQSAINFVTGVNNGTYPACGAGKTGWRLANVNELESLYNAGMANSSAWLEGWGFVNAEPFYWTSTTFAPDTVSAWVMNLRKGKVITKDKSLNYPVMLVRGTSFKRSIVWQTGQQTVYATGDDGDIQAGATWPVPRFTDNGDGTVKDELTGLVWTQRGNTPGPSGCIPGVQKSWAEALAYIDCLNATSYLGRQNWRFPNRRELRSLIDYEALNTADTLNSAGFINVRPAIYWTSTTLTNDDTKAWALRLDTGRLLFKPKTGTYSVWPVSERVSP